MMTIPAGANDFIRRQILHLDKLQILAHVRDIDHVCYRVADIAAYEEKKRALAGEADLLTESVVNGRPIAVYRLREPLQVGAFSIALFELPAPKPGRPYAEGYEHIEAVVDEELTVFKGLFPAVIFETGNIHAPVNPDIQIQTPDGVIKFHNQSLAEVIAAEQAMARPAETTSKLR